MTTFRFINGGLAGIGDTLAGEEIPMDSPILANNPSCSSCLAFARDYAKVVDLKKRIKEIQDFKARLAPKYPDFKINGQRFKLQHNTVYAYGSFWAQVSKDIQDAKEGPWRKMNTCIQRDRDE